MPLSLSRSLHRPTSSAILEKLAESSISPEKSGTLFYADGSHGNGCLMRIAPLGALAALRKFSVDELREQVRNATRCTHCHVEALDVCLIYCTVVQRLFAMDCAAMSSDDSSVRLAEAQRLFAMLDGVVESLSSVAYVREKFAAFKSQVAQLLQQTLEQAAAALSDDHRRSQLRAVDKAFLNTIISPCQVVRWMISFSFFFILKKTITCFVVMCCHCIFIHI